MREMSGGSASLREFPELEEQPGRSRDFSQGTDRCLVLGPGEGSVRGRQPGARDLAVKELARTVSC